MDYSSTPTPLEKLLVALENEDRTANELNELTQLPLPEIADAFFRAVDEGLISFSGRHKRAGSRSGNVRNHMLFKIEDPGRWMLGEYPA